MRARALSFPLLLGGMLLAAGCKENMVQQPRYDEYEASRLFEDGMAMQHPPEGTVARGAALEAAAEVRPPMTLALVERGRERYGIYCTVCHGADGRGGGTVPQRGFPRPPSYLEPRLVAAPVAHFYDVITNGYGVMYGYGDRVPPADRWAIAAYVRALQAAGAGSHGQTSAGPASNPASGAGSDGADGG